MSTLELTALLAGYSLALLRLLNAGKALWSWLPVKLQPLLPALVTVLPLFASQLGVATTELDIGESVILAIGALTTAIRGQRPVPPVALVLLFLGCSTTFGACASSNEDRAAQVQRAIDAARAACLVYDSAKAHLPKRVAVADDVCPVLLAVRMAETASVAAGGASD